MEQGYGRNLPGLLRDHETPESWKARREEIRALLEENMYGRMPREKALVEMKNLEEADGYAGKALVGKGTLTCRFGDTEFQIPVSFAFPKKCCPAPVFVVINFRAEVPDTYLPAEEVLDGGFGFLRIYYKDIVNDNYGGDFSDGLGRAYYGGRTPRGNEWGKIGMWAYAMQRALDYLETRPEADSRHLMAIGHSRLGKTALWAGATDERIYATFVNDSGAGGAAIMRAKQGEHVEHFVKSGMWDWFCGNYRAYAGREDEMPFDAHFALSLIAPRLVCVGSAEEDLWADPESECLACRAASGAWTLLGREGLVMPERGAEAGEAFLDGCVGYQKRSGTHFLSRADWLMYMEFARRHILSEKNQ